VKSPRGETVEFAASASPNIYARLYPLRRGKHLIVVPIGVYGRVIALGRRLHSYVPKIYERRMILEFATSIADDYDPEKYVVPESVRCIFDEYDLPEQFWSDLAKFDFENPHDEKTEENVRIIGDIAHIMLVAHEFAHLDCDHLAFVRDVVEAADVPNDIKQILWRGLELEADCDAARTIISNWYAEVEENQRISNPDLIEIDFHRIAFTLVMLLGVFDARKKSLSVYRHGSYAHPIVRQSAMRATIRSWLRARSSQVCGLWIEAGTRGMFDGIQAFHQLAIECMLQGGLTENSLMPLQPINFGGEPTRQYIREAMRRAQAIFEAVHKLRLGYSRGENVLPQLATLRQLADDRGDLWDDFEHVEVP
jgi:hypothetical protein